jgi:hypothetical protein
MTRRVFASILPSLWRSASGEVVSDQIVWSQQPAITTSQDRKHVFIDTSAIKAHIVLTRGGDAYDFAPKELHSLFKWVKKQHKV